MDSRYGWNPFTLVDAGSMVWLAPVISITRLRVEVNTPLLFQSDECVGMRGDFCARAGGSMSVRAGNELRKVSVEVHGKHQNDQNLNENFTKNVKKGWPLFKALQLIERLDGEGRLIEDLSAEQQQELLLVVKKKELWICLCTILNHIRQFRRCCSKFNIDLAPLERSISSFNLPPRWITNESLDSFGRSIEAQSLLRSVNGNFEKMARSMSEKPTVYGDVAVMNWRTDAMNVLIFLLKEHLNEDNELDEL